MHFFLVIRYVSNVLYLKVVDVAKTPTVDWVTHCFILILRLNIGVTHTDYH